MSIRAYRINKLEFEKAETFKISGKDKIYQWLEEKGYFLENEIGIIEIPVDVLVELLNDNKIKLSKEEKKAIQKDIDFAKLNGEAYLLYWCF